MMRVKEVIGLLDAEIGHWEHESKNTHCAELSEEDIALVRQALEILKSDYEY